MEMVRCPSCDGYGWHDDEFSGEAEECDWCAGIGYVYRDQRGVDTAIAAEALNDPAVTARLETLEAQRMAELGYSGAARKPWQQDIRKGTRGGINPYDAGDDQPK